MTDAVEDYLYQYLGDNEFSTYVAKSVLKYEEIVKDPDMSTDWRVAHLSDLSDAVTTWVTLRLSDKLGVEPEEILEALGEEID